MEAVAARERSFLGSFTTPKSLITMFITLIIMVGEWRYGAMGGYHKLALTLGTCVALELALGLLVRGVVPPLHLLGEGCAFADRCAHKYDACAKAPALGGDPAHPVACHAAAEARI